MNFNWEEFKKGNIVVNLKKFNELCDFIKQCKKRNYLWCDGNKIYNNDCNIKESHMTYGRKLCYRFNPNAKGLEYGNTEYFISHNYEVVEWSDYMEQNDIHNEKIQEIKNRVLNTTEGNWQVLYCGGSNDQCYRIATEKNIYNPICELKNRHDAEFIGKSKEDIISLLNEIELLNKELKKYREVATYEF